MEEIVLGIKAKAPDKKGEAVVIHPSGEQAVVSPKHGEKFGLAELQEMVGDGRIELVNPNDHLSDGMSPLTKYGLEMYCNEEFLVLNLPRNVIASRWVNGYIAGNVVLMKATEPQEEDIESVEEKVSE
jgi:hypothetical protein